MAKIKVQKPVKIPTFKSNKELENKAKNKNEKSV